MVKELIGSAIDIVNFIHLRSWVGHMDWNQMFP